MTKRFILALLLSCSPLWATTYYVDNCVTVGNDRNNGTSTSTPWLTINKVNTSQFNPGDSILFESTCTWREQMTVPSSGSAGNPITFGAYGTGAAPVISGANVLSATWTQVGSSSVWQASLTTQPFVVAFNGVPGSAVGSVGATVSSGQWFWGSNVLSVYSNSNPSTAFVSPGVEVSVRANEINLNGQNYLTFTGLTVQFANRNGLSPSGSGTDSNITVSSSSFYYNGGVGIASPDGSNNWVVANNTVTGNGCWVGIGNSANDNIYLDPTTGSGFSVYGNTSTLSCGDGILIGGTGQNVHNNTFAGNAGYGVDAVGASLNIYANNVYSNTNTWAAIEINGGNSNTVCRNQVYNNQGSGIVVDSGTGHNICYNVVYGHQANNGNGIQLQTGGSNSTVYNNTLYANLTGILVNTGITSALVTNNLMVGNTTIGYFGSSGTATLSYNDCWGNGSVNYYRITDPTGTNGNISANPLFANAARSQYWLASGSPAIDAGLDLGSPYNIGLIPRSTWPNSVVTGDQNAYGSGWEIGAFIYVSVAPSPPTNVHVSVH
jgi:hypothetical protein